MFAVDLMRFLQGNGGRKEHEIMEGWGGKEDRREEDGGRERLGVEVGYTEGNN